MGKMPLTGLLGLVTALGLVTTGYTDCGCKRKEPKYKAPPTFSTPNGKTDPGTQPAPANDGRATEKDAPAPPPKPDSLPTPAGPGAGAGVSGTPQTPGMTPPGGQPIQQSSLSPSRQQGFDRSDGLGSRMSMIPEPPMGQRQADGRTVSQTGATSPLPTGRSPNLDAPPQQTGTMLPPIGGTQAPTPPVPPSTPSMAPSMTPSMTPSSPAVPNNLPPMPTEQPPAPVPPPPPTQVGDGMPK